MGTHVGQGKDVVGITVHGQLTCPAAQVALTENFLDQYVCQFDSTVQGVIYTPNTFHFITSLSSPDDIITLGES